MLLGIVHTLYTSLRMEIEIFSVHYCVAHLDVDIDVSEGNLTYSLVTQDINGVALVTGMVFSI